MPFKEGNQLAKDRGRKGFELENAQLKLMRKIVDKDLRVVEKIYSGKATEKDFKKLAVLQVRVSKYLDKLHAGKTDITSDNKPLQVIVPQVVAETFGIDEFNKETIRGNKE